MTPKELDIIKTAFKRKDDASKEIWLEMVLMRNLILDSGWMSERELDLAIARGKSHPENIRQMEEYSVASDQLLEIDLADWLAELDKKYPPSE